MPVGVCHNCVARIRTALRRSAPAQEQSPRMGAQRRGALCPICQAARQLAGGGLQCAARPQWCWGADRRAPAGERRRQGPPDTGSQLMRPTALVNTVALLHPLAGKPTHSARRQDRREQHPFSSEEHIVSHQPSDTGRPPWRVSAPRSSTAGASGSAHQAGESASTGVYTPAVAPPPCPDAAGDTFPSPATPPLPPRAGGGLGHGGRALSFSPAGLRSTRR